MNASKHNPASTASVIESRAKAKTRTGYIELGDVRIECYVLEDNRRVITSRGAVKALTGNDGAKHGHLVRFLERLPSSFNGLTTEPEVVFDRLEGGIAHGRGARWFVNVCLAYGEALARGELHPKQLPLARNAQRFVSAAATVGIEQLVDDATGHVAEGEDSSTARFVRELFRKDPRAWGRLYDEEFVRETCRTFRIQRKQTFPAPLVGVIGKIYQLRLGEEGHETLRKLNPRRPDRSMHFQHFSDRLFETFQGKDLATIKTFMRMSASKDQFWHLWGWHCTGRGQLRLGW